MTGHELLLILKDEVHTLDKISSPQVSALGQSFVKYLKEPRYQSPLTIKELSTLFHLYYKDLHSLVIQQFTGSQSTKKHLIANSVYFNSNPKVFDYLLAIANYSSSSIKLLKRNDADALFQLRVFNYYKFLVIIEIIEREQLALFNLALNDENTLFDKIFRFDQKDIIYQEFLEEKLAGLKQTAVSFKNFLDIEEPMNANHKKLVDFVENMSEENIAILNSRLHDLKSVNITPLSKLTSIMNLHKALMKIFVENGFKSDSLSNDTILPTLIYLIIFKLDYQSDLYLNFVFVKHFLYLIDPYKVELYSISAIASYVPIDRSAKTLANKYRVCNLFDLLNLNECQNEPDASDTTSARPKGFEFYDNDKQLIEFLQENYLNNGEMHYYLTNFEAIITYLSEVTIGELLKLNTTVTTGAASASSTSSDEEVSSEFSNRFLNQLIASLVDEELESHFQLPDGKLEEELQNRKAEEEDKQHDSRSRSSSLMNVINNKINETRSRSNSGILGGFKSKEGFPHLPHTEGEGDNGDSPQSMMRSVLGRFSSVLVPQFRVPLEDDEMDAKLAEQMSAEDEGILSTPLKRSSVFINRVLPSHTRTRSGSLEGVAGNKRNSITSKFTNGVTELITKLNTAPNGQNGPATLDKNVSNSSLHSLETGSSMEAGESQSTLPRRPDYTRSRTTSLQIMDKWFSNLGLSQTSGANVPGGVKHRPKLSPSVESRSVEELTSFVGVDFEAMLVKDLRVMKECYDEMCRRMMGELVETVGQSKPEEEI